MRQLNLDRPQKNFSSPTAGAFTLAACFNRIMQTVRESGYSPETLETLRNDLDTVKAKLPVDDDQAVLMSLVLEEQSTNRCSESALADFLGCTNIQFIDFMEPLADLERRHIVKRFNGMRGNGCYRLCGEVLKAVQKDAAFEPRKMSGLSTSEIFTQVRVAFGDYSDRSDEEALLRDIDEIVDANPQSPFVKAVLSSGLRECPETEQRIFYCLCHRYVSFGDTSIDLDRLMDLGEEFEDMMLLRRTLTKGRTAIQGKGLVAFANENGFEDTTKLSLPDSVKEGWFPDVDIVPEKSQHRDLRSWKGIVPKELFYNPAEERQVRRLESLLEEGNYRGVLDRLAETGMRKNFTILLSGGPGVGKTETCLQLARKTQRDIFYVDMSKLKSKWFGESEKIVASVFGMYRQMCAACERTPILLLNECDAIMGTRFENVQSSTEQSENSIQNIILQNMETLEGIMICTTNLAKNLDPAFSRRFLYKVEMEAPCEETRGRIWKSMMPRLSDDEASALSREFTFAGGNIENVARKSAVEYVLSGTEPGLDTLRVLCSEETAGKGAARTRVGF